MVLASIGTFLTGHIFKEHIQNILAHPEDQPNRHIESFPIADPNDLPALPGFTPHPDDFADLPGFTPHPDDFAATRDQGGFTPHPEAAGPQILSTPILDRDPRDSILMNENRRNENHQYIPAPVDLPAFPGATPAPPRTPMGEGKLRKRWKDRKYIYEWDYQHGKVEKYNKRGKHLGEFDPDTGERTKNADNTRTVEK